MSQRLKTIITLGDDNEKGTLKYVRRKQIFNH